MALHVDDAPESEAEAFTEERVVPPRWTADHVALRLVDAFRILDRMPRVRGPRPPGDHWPRHKVEWADQLAQADLPETEKRARIEWRNREAMRPSGQDITRMEIALDWLRDLRGVDPGMALVTSLWAMRASRGRSVRALCRDKNWAPHTFYRVRGKALDYLACHLNAQFVSVF